MRLGKNKQSFLLAVFLLLAASANGQAGKSHKYQFGGNLQENDVVSSNGSVIINYSISELNAESFINEHGSFFRISIPGHTPSSSLGKPQLPVMSRLITVPEGSEYKVKISQVKSSRIKPAGKRIKGILLPVQEGETKETQQNINRFLIDEAVYASRQIIPSDTVIVESLGIVRNKTLANLFISPVRYNPRTNALEVITSMKIEITFLYTDNFDSKSLVSESTLFNESLDKGVLNYNPGDVIPGYSDQPVKMVIITDTAFKKHLEPFFKWKTQKGYKLEILYKGEGLAGDNYIQLKDTLTKIYNASSETDPPPDYLLIIGDVTRVPYYGTGNVTDMYYGEFDGNGDYIPEMYIGRLPVADTTELKSVINKIIQYEKFQFADTNKFYSKALATAGYDAGYASNMNGQINYITTNYLTEENKINEHHFLYPESYTAKDSIINLINSGVSFINYTGHGDETGWLHLNIKVQDIIKLKNKSSYPLIISNACRTAEYNIASSFGNKLVVSEEKGAIGFIGCSNDSYWDEDFYWAVGTGIISASPTYNDSGLGAFDRLFHSHGELASDWYFTMGQINYAGNLSVSASTTNRKKYYWETYNLIGDPSVIPILGNPGSYNIALPDTLPNGLKTFALDIPPFSYIAVSHFDTLWDASYASPSGSVVLEMPGLSHDSCMIVITGQNMIPLVKTIYFDDINKEAIYLTSTGINDSQGNGNGNELVDYGESFFLTMKISNLGLTDAHDLYAKISSTSDWIIIQNDSVSIGTLAARSDILLTDNFGITVSDNVPDQGIATVKLLLRDQVSEKHYTIDLCIHAPELQIISCVIDDSTLGNGNFIADPGETYNLIFKIRNLGSSDVSGQISIISLNEDMTVLEPSVKSGILKFGEITDIPIMVKLSETAPSGSYISVSASLDCDPYFVNKDYTYRVGKIRESFEAVSFNVFPWINISSVPWSITGTSAYEGIVSARSGSISHNGSTSLVLRTFYSTADSIKFYYKVSSETSYDYLAFRINDIEVFRKGGEVPWTKFAAEVSTGYNKFEWIYKKDNSVSQGSDCAWIDMIDFAGTGSVRYIQKDLQVARIVTPFQKDQFGQETVTIKVLNVGKDAINGFYLAYEINDFFVPVKQFFENSIQPYSDSVTVSFKTKADLSKYGIYDIIAYGSDNNDDYTLNDTLQIKLENTSLSESLSVFPNPFTDHITIFVNSKISDKLQISLTNVSGMKLYEVEKEISSGNNEITLSNINLLPSLYYLRIQGTVINKSVPVLKINK